MNEDNYLHIHIREMKGADGITRISITLNKRRKYIHITKYYKKKIHHILLLYIKHYYSKKKILPIDNLVEASIFSAKNGDLSYLRFP